MGTHVTATCTEFSAGYGGPGQVYSLHPHQHEGREKRGLSPTSSSSLLFSFEGSAPLVRRGQTCSTLIAQTRPLVKSSRLPRCFSLRPRPKYSLNRSLNRGHQLTTPLGFIMIMAPVFTGLHKQGIWFLQYLDDWLLWPSFYQEALDLTQVLLWLFAWLGICINFNKSCLHPVQELGFLGVNI